MTLTFFFVYCFVNYYSKILLQLWQLCSTDHFIAEVTLYQMLESGKDTSLQEILGVLNCLSTAVTYFVTRYCASSWSR